MMLLAKKEHSMADFVSKTGLMLTHAPERRTGVMVMVMMMMMVVEMM